MNRRRSKSQCEKMYLLTCGLMNNMKTCVYSFDPLKPHFYVVKLGFTGAYIIFLISAQNIDCGYSLELPHWGGSNEYPQSMFWAEIWKISDFFIWKLSVFGGKIFNIFEKACFRNGHKSVCTSTVSDQSLHYLHEEILHPWWSKMGPVNILIRLLKLAGWLEFSLGGYIWRYSFWHCGSYTGLWKYDEKIVQRHISQRTSKKFQFTCPGIRTS